ncbi:hypothetical protein Tco_1390545 [Tanacetum coccineum]
MLRWTCGKSMVDMISNRVFRAKLNVDSIIDKMRERRLRWFGHLKRRPQTAPVRRVEAMVVDGSRRRGRPKLRWDDRLKQDMKELRLSEDMTYDKNAWRDRIRTSNRRSTWKQSPYPRVFLRVLTDGGVIVLKRQESKEKWGTSPSAKNGAGPSSITVGETSTTDQSQRGFYNYMVPDICVNKELEDGTLTDLEYERTYQY